MTGTTFFTTAFVLAGVSAAVQAVWLFRRDRALDPFSHWLLAGTAVFLAAALVLRSFAIGFPALTGTWESLAFYAAAVAALCFAYRLQRRLPVVRLVVFFATVTAIALLAIASSPLVPAEALPPIPALRSAWLLLHVSFSFIGEAFFVTSFAASILFLAARDPARRAECDRVTYTAVAIGYPIFIAGALVFGAIWAEQAWGAWWSWDPKETWALVTCLVYTVYLHLRLVVKRRDAWPAIVSVVGFLCTVFTFFGVNYLLAGLHSYG
ncbi:MAG: cytochrome c biogenesis protein CcsA [Spirochaetes bacterium]|nr:cytochrome c biogenesis protein CcsA [Spirochaetota bacterium]